MVLCMVLALTVPLLAQPAKADDVQVEPYEGTPLFVIGMRDADGNVSAAINGFLVQDPETGSTFLLGPSVIYDLVQNGYTVCVLGDDSYFQTAIPVAKENGVTYLYAPGLGNAPYLELGNGSRNKAAAVYREITADGTIELLQRNYDLSSGWQEGSDGFLTYTGYQLDTTYLIGAPMLDAEDGSVLGSISVSRDQEMMLVPLVQGQLSAEYSIETLSGVSSGSETPTTEKPDSSGSSDSDKSISWAAVIVAAGAAGYLFFRNGRKKESGAKEKEGTIVLEAAPAPAGDTMPIQDPTPAALWQLRCVSGTRNGQTFPMGGTLRIGRNPQCDIFFPENTPGVSGTHCEVSVEGDRVVLRDLNSTYGTYLGENNRLEANRSYGLHRGDRRTRVTPSFSPPDDNQRNKPAADHCRWFANFYSCFFHNLQHHLGSQTKAILKQQALCHILKLPQTVHVQGKQLLLYIGHSDSELLFVSANQLISFLVFPAG